MNALNAEDFVLLLLALELMDRHTANELSQARRQGNNAKQAAMLNLRSRLIVLRAKVRAIQVLSS